MPVDTKERRTPLLLVGDQPMLPTGLSRILRDLAAHITQDPSLPVDLAVAGWDESFRGLPDFPVPVYGFTDRDEDWGAQQVEAIWRAHFGTQTGILWTIWDPGRLLGYAELAQRFPVHLWAYTAVDAHAPSGALGGPARAALQAYDRVLGYGRWGSEVLAKTLGRKIPYLPHGLDLETFCASDLAEPVDLGPWYHDQPVIGCVAANQPRKDLGLYCQTLRLLLDRGTRVFGWLHVDRIIGPAWSVPELVDQFNLRRHLTVTTHLTERELADYYRACSVTVGPGLGEGFGYPLAESLACGVPAVHGRYGGGVALVPSPQWTPPVQAFRLEGAYALMRPVYSPADVANAVQTALDQVQVNRTGTAAYCTGAVAHLDWRVLWPRWASWIRAGIREVTGD